MGFFDLFKRKSAIEKHGERVADKRAVAGDRWESIRALGMIATTEPNAGAEDERSAAVAALFPRFTYYVDPPRGVPVAQAITDEEEKDEVLRWVVEAGEDVSLEPLRAAMKTQDSLSWALRCLERMLPADRAIEEMIALLGTMSTDYQRDPTRKQQLLGRLEELSDPRIAEAVAPHFTDVDEMARFHATIAALRQANGESQLTAIREALEMEESVRVKVRVLDLLVEKGWSLGEGASKIELPDGYALDKSGKPRRAK
ncbi:MAG: hypothetical protein AB7S26_09060 [Sandaracinaceae bacterium]